MSSVTLILLFSLCFLLACGSAPKPVVPTGNVRNYNGTASVGDFLTISVDSVAHTIAYQNFTNNESGTVPYTVNADGSYAITDPQTGTCCQRTKYPDT